MENKKNKLKLFKRIGAIVCAVAVTIVAFSLPFLGNFKSKFNSKNMVASADEVVGGAVGFEGSTYCLSISGGFLVTNPSTGAQETHPYNGSANIRYSYVFNSSNKIVVTITISDLSLRVDRMPGARYVSLTGPFVGTYTCTLGSTESKYVRFDLSSSQAIYITFDYAVSSSFNLDLISFQISTTSSSSAKWTNFVYNDNGGSQFTFAVMNRNENWSFYDSASFISYSTRTYYFSTALSDNEYYQSGYNEGNSYGYSQGYSAGESDGYSSGYSAGETIGYNNGYSQGVEAGGNYSFFSLISAVIDAPIQAFMGLFNFELLGINLAGFFTGLLTLAFIITIVRLVMP